MLLHFLLYHMLRSFYSSGFQVRVQIIFVVIAFLAFTHPSVAQTVQLKNAVIITSPSISTEMRATVSQVLSEEIAKRTGILLK
ncbi:MAG TPA: hypothetical protein PLR74_05780, partial [Agriterribacter sp.]|nr:hypothetical protein [Agriterribacter sp.]